MGLRQFLVLATLAINCCLAQNQTTWVSTSFITAKYVTSSTVKYDSTAVTPVRSSTAFSITSLYASEAPTTSDKTVTRWITEQTTFPVSTYTAAVSTTLSTPFSVRSNGTSTIVAWVSPTLATVILSPTACVNSAGLASNSTLPAKIETVYTGTYNPVSGQVTTVSTSWPTAVTTYITVSASYRVLTYIGSTVAVDSTVTASNWLLTTTVSSNKTVTVAPFRYTNTVYDNTATVTSSDWQLAYITKAAPSPCPANPTVTRAAQCAPTNLISERDGHGAAVQLLPLEWAFPIGFPSTLIGIPGMDASACCQLCLDNPGCAASEWTVSWSGACRLYYYIHGNDTCGGGTSLQYYGDLYEFPGQASYLQEGCGQLRYDRVKDPFCPTCEVIE